MGSLSESRVAVTGAAGFVGRAVSLALEAAGASVTPIIRHPDDLGHDRARAGDLRDPDFVTGAIATSDLVIHLAARSGGIANQAGDGIYRDNRAMTDAVLAAAAKREVRRVFLASSSVVYRDAGEPLTEAHPTLGPADEPSPYARSKIADEVAGRWMVAHGGPEVVIGRFGNVIGRIPDGVPRRTTVLYDLAARLRADKGPLVVWGDGSAVRSFVHVDDVASGVVWVMAGGESGSAYNIDSGEAVSVGEVARLLADIIDPSRDIVFDPQRPSGPAHRVPDITRLRGLGYEPRITLAQALEDTVG